MTNSQEILDQIKLECQSHLAGILTLGKLMASLIGQTVINISDIDLNRAQIEALQKGPTLFPTTGPTKKSMIWNHFKAFHRRLVLHHFYNDNNILMKMIENWSRYLQLIWIVTLILIELSMPNLNQKVDGSQITLTYLLKASNWHSKTTYYAANLTEIDKIV